MNNDIFDYIKKLSKQDKKTLPEKTLKTVEEVGELAKVVLPYAGAASTTHRFVGRERILEEVADTLLCALSVAYDVGYDHDALAEMMLKKAAYWEELQARENKVSYPLPYEIHITTAANSEKTLEEFKIACAETGVKPLLIDMHNEEGATIMLDTQTSSVHMGDNTSAITEVKRIAKSLSDRGFKVIREKVETVPWHPAAPQASHANPLMPKDCYFEAHFNIIVTDETLQKLRNNSANHPSLGLHISRNAFKHISETEYVMMATLRWYQGTYEGFREECENVKDILTGMGFIVPKTITEFSIYDTKISHDSAWIG